MMVLAIASRLYAFRSFRARQSVAKPYSARDARPSILISVALLGAGVMGYFNDHVGLRGDLKYLRTSTPNAARLPGSLNSLLPRS
jgi:hypothetical protein